MPKKPPFDDQDDLSGLARDVVRELKATTNLVVDAARLGKDELLRYVSESLRNGLSIDPERPRESRREPDSSSQRQAEQAERRERRRAATGYVPSVKKPKKLRIRQVSRDALWLYILGGCLYLPALILWSVCLHEFFYGSFPFSVACVATGFTVAGSLPMLAGRRKRKKEKLYDRYRNAVGAAPRIRLDEVAARMRRGYGEVLKDVNDMVERGYFGPEASLDAVRGILIVDPYAPIMEAMEEEEPPQREDDGAESGKSAPQEPSAEQAPPDTYEALLLELRLLNERIEDEAMSSRIYRIEAVARATFLAVREKPEKRVQIQRFMDYYLPTTIKLLSAYADFEKQTVVGDNIRSSRENIERMMETLSEAYEKQFDSLFRSETMDINAEIRTMDSLLRQDGYVGGFTMPSSSAAAEKKE